MLPKGDKIAFLWPLCTYIQTTFCTIILALTPMGNLALSIQFIFHHTSARSAERQPGRA